MNYGWKKPWCWFTERWKSTLFDDEPYLYSNTCDTCMCHRRLMSFSLRVIRLHVIQIKMSFVIELCASPPLSIPKLSFLENCWKSIQFFSYQLFLLNLIVKRIWNFPIFLKKISLWKLITSLQAGLSPFKDQHFREQEKNI